MATIYLRKEKATMPDNVVNTIWYDVVAYRDRHCTDFVARWPAGRDQPYFACPVVTLNCVIYRAIWVNP